MKVCNLICLAFSLLVEGAINIICIDLLLRNLLIRLHRLLRVLLVALIGVDIDGLAVPGRLAHWILGLLLLLLHWLSSDRLLVMHLNHVHTGVLGGVVAADGSIIFGYATSAFGSGNAGYYAEDEEECSERPPEPYESGMTVA